MLLVYIIVVSCVFSVDILSCNYAEEEAGAALCDFFLTGSEYWPTHLHCGDSPFSAKEL
jgi:hypothetical protein